jgi:hypothetical protein
MSLIALNVALLSTKQSAFVFLLGTYVTLSCSLALQARCVSAANAVCKSTDIFRNSGVNIKKQN